jgi:DedD protein
MIRLPKLFKRKTQADELNRDSAGLRRTTSKSIPRHLQRPSENDELALTEDPERQRARHRLIGATVLVLIAVIGLPRILDSKPKSINNDIAVNIVTSLPAPSAISAAPEVKPAPPTIAAEKPRAPEVVAETAKDSVPLVESKSEAKQVPVLAPAPSTPIAIPAAAKNSALGLAAGEEVVAASSKPKLDSKPLPKVDDVHPKSPVSGSGKFVIQIGAFASEDRAKGWTAKMKDQKIPNYTNTKTGVDGGKLFLLRAGPFGTRESAEAAEKKLKAMGLTPHLVEVGAN